MSAQDIIDGKQVRMPRGAKAEAFSRAARERGRGKTEKLPWE
jgi:hypothetical protein